MESDEVASSTAVRSGSEGRYREGVARYYDLAPHRPDDVPFYLERLFESGVPAEAGPRVLELGCGTGRVSIPLLDAGAHVHGVDHSVPMLDVLRKVTSGRPDDRLLATVGDITHFDLGETFDWIIAPFRVIQNLETDAQLEGLFRCIDQHLAPGGRCILNAFRPNRDRTSMIAEWPTGREHPSWTVETEQGVVTCHDRRLRVQEEPLVLYPELVYRRTVDGRVVDEAVLSIAMRCFYPEEFVDRIQSAGFTVTKRWGGYAGEEYGVGPELVVEFRAAS